MSTLFLYTLLVFPLGLLAQDMTQTYHENGQLKAEGSLKNNQREGIWTLYHPNGEVNAKGNYTNNEPHSKWMFCFYPNGKVKKQGYLLNGLKENT